MLVPETGIQVSTWDAKWQTVRTAKELYTSTTRFYFQSRRTSRSRKCGFLDARGIYVTDLLFRSDLTERTVRSRTARASRRVNLGVGSAINKGTRRETPTHYRTYMVPVMNDQTTSELHTVHPTILLHIQLQSTYAAYNVHRHVRRGRSSQDSSSPASVCVGTSERRRYRV